MWRRGLLLAYFVALLALSLLQLRTGLADNGDFERDVCPYMTQPLGFTAYSPSDPAEHERRFVHYWYDRWQLRPGWYDVGHICQGSSQQLLVLFEVALSKLLLGRQVYSVTLGGLVPRALSWLLWLGFAAWFHRLASGRLVFLVPTTLSWLLFNERVFAGLINSFYEDLTGVLAFAGVTLLLARFGDDERPRALWGAIGCLVMLTAAKTAYLVCPVVVLACAALARLPRLRTLAAGCALAIVAALPLTIRDSNRPINAYDATYTGALMLLGPDERADLVQPRGRYEAACVGVPFGDPGCLGRNRWLTHGDALRIYLTHPRAIVRALEKLRRDAVPGRVELGLTQPPDASGKSRSFAMLPLFGVWSALLAVVAVVWWPLLVASVAALVWARRRLVPSQWLALTLTLATALTQQLVMLADGATDFGRHGLLATFALGLYLTLATAALLTPAARRS